MRWNSAQHFRPRHFFKAPLLKICPPPGYALKPGDLLLFHDTDGDPKLRQSTQHAAQSNKKRREQSSRQTDTTTTKWAQPTNMRGKGRNGRERKTKLKSQKRYQSILKRARAFRFQEFLSLLCVFFERTRVAFQRSDQEQDKENIYEKE